MQSQGVRVIVHPSITSSPLALASLHTHPYPYSYRTCHSKAFSPHFLGIEQYVPHTCLGCKWLGEIGEEEEAQTKDLSAQTHKTGVGGGSRGRYPIRGFKD
ncbi:hypothetical protein KCU77_g50, partial [Aureobasidium melanogenum]